MRVDGWETPKPAVSSETLSRFNRRAVTYAVLVAIVLRVAALFITGDIQPYSSIRETYFSTAAGLASGYGYITETPVATANNNGFDEPMSVVRYMGEREAAGGRVDREHPFPKNSEGWLPGTRHPHGYGTLIYLIYSVSNYTPTLWVMHFIQILADAAACIFVFIFVRNVFEAPVARVASWLYALCPPAIFLSLDLLPDAFHGFFVSMVLASASFMPSRGVRFACLTGAALGIASYFRPEYILLPAVLCVCYWAASRCLVRSLGCATATVGMMLLIQLPWAFWMKSVTGNFRFTSTTTGGGLYSCLGEDPGNPWGIVSTDGWIYEDARKKGFTSAWSVEADRYYAARFREYVRAHPARYAKTVLTLRLPLALATPYDTGNRSTRSEFNFTKYRVEEGLTRWGVVKKYPLTVLRYMWPQFAMLAYSGMLTLCVAAAIILRFREWRGLVWIVLPWAYPIVTITLFKAVEPRNMAPTLVPALTAAAIVLWTAWDRALARFVDARR